MVDLFKVSDVLYLQTNLGGIIFWDSAAEFSRTEIQRLLHSMS